MRVSTLLDVRSIRYGLAVAVIALAAGVAYVSQPADAGVASAPPPPPTVEVLEMAPVAVRDWESYSGRLAAVQSVAIKPLVGGRIEQVLFEDGQQVSQGQLLFVIDPRPHAARRQQAEAQLATAESRAQLAADELARSERLVKQKLVAQSVFDAAYSNHQVAQAAVLQAQAELQQAELNLAYAHIRAPIAGRISRAELTLGNVVDAGPSAPVLASVVSSDSLYAEFHVDEASYIRFVRKAAQPAEMPVEMTLASDDSVTYQGQIASFDNQLDSHSGTIRARALFENRDGALTPGMFVKLRLGAPQLRDALLVPERAIGTNQSKKFVLVVDAHNVAQYREVQLGELQGNARVVVAGLTAGDRIIVNGLSHVRPNAPVNPVLSTELVGAPTS